MRARVLATLTAVGCGYSPGSFHSPLQSFPGQHATVGCLDVAVDRRQDRDSGEIIVEYAFGNRCDRPALVDLAAAVVRGRTADQQTVALVAYDPRGQILPLRIDGRAVGGETIAYVTDTPLREVCVDAASIVHADSPAWSCFPSQPEPEVP